MEVGPGIDIKVRRHGDDAHRLGDARRQQSCQRPAAAVSEPDDAGEAALLEHALESGGHAGYHGFGVSLVGPEGAGTGRDVGKAVVARSTKVQAGRGIKGHEPEHQRLARGRVYSGSAGLPGSAIAVDVNMENVARPGGGLKDDVLKRCSGHDAGLHAEASRQVGQSAGR
jgi:hypothetical protein